MVVNIKEETTMKRIRKTGAVFLALIMAVAMSATVFADTLTEDDAVQNALKDAKLDVTQIKALEVEMDSETNSYEIEFIQKSNKTEFDYEIAADSGMILEKSVDYAYKHNKSKKKIGKTKARKIVAKASGVSLKAIKKGTCKYTYKKQGKYELKFRSGNYKYEYELLAPNGKIIEYEYEYIGTR